MCAHPPGAVPHAVFVENLEGGQPVVAGHALLVLRFRLGQVDVDAKPLIPGDSGQILPHAGGQEAGVLPVDGHVDGNLTVTGPVPPLRQSQRLGAGDKLRRVGNLLKDGDPPGQIHVQAGIQHSLRHIVAEVVHIREGGDAVGDHLRRRQPGARPDGLRGQLGLHREDILVQPGLQVVAAAVAPHQGHGGVAVGVHQTGHQYLPAAAVDDLTVVPGGGGTGGEGGDLSVLHHQMGVLQHVAALVHGDDGEILQQNLVCGHKRSPFVETITAFPDSRGSGRRTFHAPPRRR